MGDGLERCHIGVVAAPALAGHVGPVPSQAITAEVEAGLVQATFERPGLAHLVGLR